MHKNLLLQVLKASSSASLQDLVPPQVLLALSHWQLKQKDHRLPTVVNICCLHHFVYPIIMCGFREQAPHILVQYSWALSLQKRINPLNCEEITASLQWFSVMIIENKMQRMCIAWDKECFFKSWILFWMLLPLLFIFSPLFSPWPLILQSEISTSFNCLSIASLILESKDSVTFKMPMKRCF